MYCTLHIHHTACANAISYIQAGDLPSEANLCTSAASHIWGPILLVYKAVELVFSLIFAFETRKIKIKELNDSRMVIFSVYTIVVAGIAVAPVIALLSDRVTVKYAIIGIICLASATLLLGMNFIPKVCCAIFWLLVLCTSTSYQFCVWACTILLTFKILQSTFIWFRCTSCTENQVAR